MDIIKYEEFLDYLPRIALAVNSDNTCSYQEGFLWKEEKHYSLLNMSQY